MWRRQPGPFRHPGWRSLFGFGPLPFLPLVPPTLHATILLNVEANPIIEVTLPSPLTVAPSQSLEIIGAFFGYAQGSTTITFNFAGGLSVPLTPTSWVTAQSGTYTDSQVIAFTLPSNADLSSNSSIVFTNGLFGVTQSLTVEAPLALPGGTTGTRSQPVSITGTGFGATLGTLTYFSANGAPTSATPTDWSNTLVRTNVPGTADIGPGYFWVFPTGATRENGIFTGFTIGAASGPATTLFPNGQSVTSNITNGTYPIPPGSSFPRGIVQNPGAGLGNYLVAWLEADGVHYSEITTPSANMTSMGSLCAKSQSVLGVFPPVNIIG
jgi:hypothetical protein